MFWPNVSNAQNNAPQKENIRLANVHFLKHLHFRLRYDNNAQLKTTLQLFDYDQARIIHNQRVTGCVLPFCRAAACSLITLPPCLLNDELNGRERGREGSRLLIVFLPPLSSSLPPSLHPPSGEINK